jgi:hypothetical protein
MRLQGGDPCVGWAACSGDHCVRRPDIGEPCDPQGPACLTELCVAGHCAEAPAAAACPAR